MTEGTPPPSSAARTHATPAASGLTAAEWNRGPRTARARGLPHWPQWLRAIPETTRPDVLMRLFAALFLLLPGSAMVISTHRHAFMSMTSAVLSFIVVHGALHALSAWRSTSSRPIPAPLHNIDKHAAWMMLASASAPAVVQGVHPHSTSTLAVTGLAVGALCQVCSVCMTSERLRSTLLVLASALQFIAVALLSAKAAG